MFNLQGSEIIIIMLLALVVLGPEKLPDAVRRFSKTYSELKKMGSGFQTELKSALDEPMREMRETAKMVRDAADPTKIANEAESERRLSDEASGSASEPLHSSDVESQSFEGVSDTGSDVVATAGQAPDSARTADDNLISDGPADEQQSNEQPAEDPAEERAEDGAP